LVETLVDKSPYSMECTLHRADGTAFCAHLTAARPSNAESLIIGVRDISAQKEAFLQLEANELRYRNLFRYMPIGLAQIDASGLVSMFKALRQQGVEDITAYIDENPAFLTQVLEVLEVEEVNLHILGMFGAKSASQMLGPIARYWKASLPTLRRSIEARYRGEAFFQEETRTARLDGEIIDVLFATARHGAIADKSLVGFIDITGKKKSEAALRRSERRLRQVEAEFAHAARVSMLGELTAS